MKKYNKMKTRVKNAWLKALRSGEYKQGKNYLCNTKKGEDTFCCLGVLYDIEVSGYWRPSVYGDFWGYKDQIWEINGEFTRLGDKFRDRVGITKEQEFALTRLNDRSRSFEKVIKYIENNL